MDQIKLRNKFKVLPQGKHDQFGSMVDIDLEQARGL